MMTGNAKFVQFMGWKPLTRRVRNHVQFIAYPINKIISKDYTIMVMNCYSNTPEGVTRGRNFICKCKFEIVRNLRNSTL